VHDHKQELIRLYGRDRHIDLSSERDAIAAVARIVAAESRLLCFDEFHVTDIADALIMTRLFSELWAQGTILVATSNRHPDDLYENGLNRSYFMPFIDLLKKQCMTIELNTSKDYRMENVTEANSYFVPLNDQSRKQLHDAFLRSGDASASAAGIKTVPALEKLPVMMGRQIEVEGLGDSCFVTFEALCEADRGPADYHAICKRYNCVYLDGIRQLSLKVCYAMICYAMINYAVLRLFILFVWDIS
jgi:predicted ATPase